MFILYAEINKEILMFSFPKESECYDIVKKTNVSHYKIVPIQYAKDPYFLGCLEWNAQQNDFIVNINKAKLEVLSNLRLNRIVFFQKLDVEYMKSLEQNNQEKMSTIASLKQRLRDVTTEELPNNAESLKIFVPQVFLDIQNLNL